MNPDREPALAATLGGAELAELLRRGHSSDPWHGPATSDLLSQIGAADAARRPDADAHTIWEIVLHMTAWQREVASRLAGRTPRPPAEGDWPVPPPPSEAAWAAAKEDLRESLEAVATLAAGLSAPQLQALVGAARDRALGSGVTMAEMLAGLLQHNAYHSGQIALLTKARRAEET